MLAEHNLAFRGQASTLREPESGNFLSLVELLSQNNPVMSEHVRRAKNNEIADHYLGKSIQNKLKHIEHLGLDISNAEDRRKMQRTEQHEGQELWCAAENNWILLSLFMPCTSHSLNNYC